jgi:hypothetical protein
MQDHYLPPFDHFDETPPDSRSTSDTGDGGNRPATGDGFPPATPAH